MRTTTGRRRLAALRMIVPMLALLGAGRTALANEPRPWLCRQIPVFSGVKSMTWKATKRGAGHWIMTFMHYDPAGGHDGFTVVSTQEVAGGAATGTLEAGQYYAVALYRSGGHWICPGNARESHDSATGAISNLCYGEDDGACDVKLMVGAADASTSR